MSLAQYLGSDARAAADAPGVLVQCGVTGRFYPQAELLWSQEASTTVSRPAARWEISSLYCPTALSSYTASQASELGNASSIHSSCPSCGQRLAPEMTAIHVQAVYRCEYCRWESSVARLTAASSSGLVSALKSRRVTALGPTAAAPTVTISSAAGLGDAPAQVPSVAPLFAPTSGSSSAAATSAATAAHIRSELDPALASAATSTVFAALQAGLGRFARLQQQQHSSRQSSQQRSLSSLARPAPAARAIITRAGAASGPFGPTLIFRSRRESGGGGVGLPVISADEVSVAASRLSSLREASGAAAATAEKDGSGTRTRGGTGDARLVYPLCPPDRVITAHGDPTGALPQVIPLAAASSSLSSLPALSPAAPAAASLSAGASAGSAARASSAGRAGHVLLSVHRPRDIPTLVSAANRARRAGGSVSEGAGDVAGDADGDCDVAVFSGPAPSLGSSCFSPSSASASAPSLALAHNALPLPLLPARLPLVSAPALRCPHSQKLLLKPGPDPARPAMTLQRTLARCLPTLTVGASRAGSGSVDVVLTNPAPYPVVLTLAALALLPAEVCPALGSSASAVVNGGAADLAKRGQGLEAAEVDPEAISALISLSVSPVDGRIGSVFILPAFDEHAVVGPKGSVAPRLNTPSEPSSTSTSTSTSSSEFASRECRVSLSSERQNSLILSITLPGGASAQANTASTHVLLRLGYSTSLPADAAASGTAAASAESAGAGRASEVLNSAAVKAAFAGVEGLERDFASTSLLALLVPKVSAEFGNKGN